MFSPIWSNVSALTLGASGFGAATYGKLLLSANFLFVLAFIFFLASFLTAFFCFLASFLAAFLACFLAVFLAVFLALSATRSFKHVRSTRVGFGLGVIKCFIEPTVDSEYVHTVPYHT